MNSNAFFAKLDRPDKAMTLRLSPPFSKLRRSCKILLCLAALLLPDFSFGATSYYLCPLKTHGIDRETMETFRILLYIEISEAGGKVDLLQDCASPTRNLKSPNAARIKGSIRRLGQKIIPMLVLSSETGQERIYSLVLKEIEEFDIAAKRFASAIVNKTDIAIPELGQVIQAEVPTEARRGVNNSLYFRLGGMSPIGKNYDSGEGVLFSVGAWSETKGFAIEKTFGIRKSTAHPNDYNSFWEYSTKLGALRILGTTDTAFIAGGGFGLFLLGDKYLKTVVESPMGLRTTHVEKRSGTSYGGGFYGKAGILLFRTYSVRMTATVEYSLAFAKTHWDSRPQSLGFSIGIIY